MLNGPLEDEGVIEWLKENAGWFFPALTVVGGIAIGVGRWTWAHLKAAYRACAGLVEAVHAIKKEVLPNGGSSISDRVSKTDATLSAMSKRGARVAATVETLADSSKWPMFRTDERGGCTWINEAFFALTGRTMDQMRGMNGLLVVVEEDRGRVTEEWESAVELERDFELDYRIYGNGNRSHITVRCHAQVFRDEATGKFLGHVGRVRPLRNISDQHRRELD